MSTIAPSTSHTLTIPAVFVLAGDGTWLAYLLALGAMVLVAVSIAVFARDSASPGSLYTCTRASLPPGFAVLAACALLFAYTTTASLMLGGFCTYGFSLLSPFGVHPAPQWFALVAATAVVWFAAHDVKLSARTMLWVEMRSMIPISCILARVLWKHGPDFDIYLAAQPAQVSSVLSSMCACS